MHRRCNDCINFAAEKVHAGHNAYDVYDDDEIKMRMLKILAAPFMQ